ncbi:MAG: hypothetical protein M1818_004643 [Claussenomyces sp. TS43310]|nr:MAG: hypothetical protein M1818_004643 [Claussenomyces sp. TS43310]
MAATPPRRVLGPLDGNKSMHQTPRLSTPEKRTGTLRSPTKSLVSPSPLSPLGSAKRKLLDVDMGTWKKRRALLGRSVESHDDEADPWPESIPAGLQASKDSQSSASEHGEAGSSQGTARGSPSPSVIFDIANDTQLTVLTEPEDLVATALPIPHISEPGSIARTGTQQQQVRDNAEALRLRLKVAMYKVRTNQISLPLSQLSIIPPRPNLLQSRGTESSARARASPSHLMPLASANAARPAPYRTGAASTLSPPKLSVSLGQLAASAIPSLPASDHSSPPRPSPATSPHLSPTKEWASSTHDFATPVLPRSRDGLDSNSGYHDESHREADDRDLTSSVVKKGAADGLLRLMGGP